MPANIGIIKNAPNQEGAVKFIEFLLSPEGQQVLLNPAIMRLPVNPAAYKNAPEGFPNPFSESFAPGAIEFDVDVSGERYNLVNSLFDVLVTYRLEDLRAAVSAVQKAEAAQAKSGNEKAATLIAEARKLIEAMPITEAQAADPSFAHVFTTSRAKPDTKVVGRQAEVEQEWDTFAVENYRKARELAEQAAAL